MGKHRNGLASFAAGFGVGTKVGNEWNDASATREINAANEAEDASRPKMFDASQGEELERLAPTHDITYENGKYVATPKATEPAVVEPSEPVVDTQPPQDGFSAGFNGDGTTPDIIAQEDGIQPAAPISMAPPEQVPAPVPAEAGKTFAPATKAPLTDADRISRHQRDSSIYTRYGMTDNARDAENRAQAMVASGRQGDIHARLTAKDNRENADRDALSSIGAETAKQQEDFAAGRGIQGTTPDLIRIGGYSKMAVELEKQGNPEAALKLRQANEAHASGVALQAIQQGDMRTLQTMLGMFYGKKYEGLAVEKDKSGNEFITGRINGEQSPPVPMREFVNSLAARAFPREAFAADKQFDLADQVRQSREYMKALELQMRGGGGTRGSAGSGGGGKQGAGQDSGYLGVPGLKTREDWDKFINESMGGKESMPAVTDKKGNPVEGVDRQGYRERFDSIATDLATGGNGLQAGVLAKVTHRMVRDGYAGGNIKQDIDVSKDGEARRVVTIDGRMYNLGGKLSDGEAIDFLERSYSGPPEQKAVAIQKFRVDKEYARATSAAKEFAVLDDGGAVVDKNGTKLTKQAIVNSMGGGEEGLQRYNEAKDAANTLAELATTKYQEFRATHVDEGRRGEQAKTPKGAPGGRLPGEDVGSRISGAVVDAAKSPLLNSSLYRDVSLPAWKSMQFMGRGIYGFGKGLANPKGQQ